MIFWKGSNKEKQFFFSEFSRNTPHSTLNWWLIVCLIFYIYVKCNCPSPVARCSLWPFVICFIKYAEFQKLQIFMNVAHWNAFTKRWPRDFLEFSGTEKITILTLFNQSSGFHIGNFLFAAWFSLFVRETWSK